MVHVCNIRDYIYKPQEAAEVDPQKDYTLLPEVVVLLQMLSLGPITLPVTNRLIRL